jgi:hypothetical protein
MGWKIWMHSVFFYSIWALFRVVYAFKLHTCCVYFYSKNNTWSRFEAKHKMI